MSLRFHCRQTPRRPNLCASRMSRVSISGLSNSLLKNFPRAFLPTTPQETERHEGVVQGEQISTSPGSLTPQLCVPTNSSFRFLNISYFGMSFSRFYCLFSDLPHLAIFTAAHLAQIPRPDALHPSRPPAMRHPAFKHSRLTNQNHPPSSMHNPQCT